MFAYASRGARELPNSRVYVDGDVEGLSKTGTFIGQHICVPLEGAAIHINAFNFPVWGMLEKLAPTLLAGMPAIVKPATTTAYLTELVVRRIVESGILPEGALQLVCGSLGDAFDHLTCQDVVSFTGSASTAQKLRTHPTIVANSVRFISETDSINSCVLGPDAAPGQPEFDAFVREVVREMTAKAGQKCTAIRKAIVPAAHAEAAAQAIKAGLAKVVVGDPRLEQVRMGPLAALAQRREVLGRIAELRREAELLTGEAETLQLAGADREKGAFVAPALLFCREPKKAKAIHTVEAFGPVCTVVPYASVSDAVAYARGGEGSLVGSVFTADDDAAVEFALGLAPLHGRLLIVNRDCAKESTGHGSPLPGLVHGGPGRAGGGEEMGGIRGLMHYMQRTAIQGSPQTVARITGRWTRGAAQKAPGVHPFSAPGGRPDRRRGRGTSGGRWSQHASRDQSGSRQPRSVVVVEERVRQEHVELLLVVPVEHPQSPRGRPHVHPDAVQLDMPAAPATRQGLRHGVSLASRWWSRMPPRARARPRRRSSGSRRASTCGRERAGAARRRRPGSAGQNGSTAHQRPANSSVSNVVQHVGSPAGKGTSPGRRTPSSWYRYEAAALRALLQVSRCRRRRPPPSASR